MQDTYTLTAIFSRAINLLMLDTLLQWSIFYAVIFNILILLIANRHRPRYVVDYIWFFMTIALLNIYIFNLGKDVFQFFIFILMYFILSSNLSSPCKAFLSFAILGVWGMVFRIYYLLIAIYFLLTYVFTARGKRMRLMWGIVIGVVFLSLYLASVFSTSNYHRIIFVRDVLNLYREGDVDALTIINNVFSHEGNLFLYMVNYVFILLRMIFPLELLAQANLRYVVSFVYQFIISYLLIRKLKDFLRGKGSKEQMLAYVIYAAFLACSALFEPDFGSWLRHQSAISPIMMVIFFERKTLIYRPGTH